MCHETTPFLMKAFLSKWENVIRVGGDANGIIFVHMFCDGRCICSKVWQKLWSTFYKELSVLITNVLKNLCATVECFSKIDATKQQNPWNEVSVSNCHLANRKVVTLLL